MKINIIKNLTYFEEHFGTSRIKEFFPSDIPSEFYNPDNKWNQLAKFLDKRDGDFPQSTKFILHSDVEKVLEPVLLHLKVMLKSGNQLELSETHNVKCRIPSVAYILSNWFKDIII